MTILEHKRDIIKRIPSWTLVHTCVKRVFMISEEREIVENSLNKLLLSVQYT